MLNNLPEDEMKEQIVQRRAQESLMPEDGMFREGSISIAEVIPLIKDALLSKDGLVEPDKQELFREQIANTLNDRILAQLARSTKALKNSDVNEDGCSN